MFIPQEERDGCIDRELLHAPMKLSEAVREGCKRGPQLKCDLYVLPSGASCFYGAAMLGLGMGDGYSLSSLMTRLPSAQAAMYAFQDAHGYTPMDANDTRGWTREQIADWMESKGF